MLQVLPHKQLKKCSLILLFFCVLAGQAGVHAKDNIVIVDIPYELLAALGEYEELRSTEKTLHRSMNAEIAPILQIILQEYTRQYDTLTTLMQHFEDPEPLQQRLEKMAYFIDLFKDELTYRNLMLDYQKAMQKQRELMETQ